MGTNSMKQLDEEQLHSLYSWIDSIPLSRPKKSIGRDFADGVMVAELLKFYMPRLVDLHNYSAANSYSQKVYNFNTLNQKVLKKVNYNLSEEQIINIVNVKPGSVESFLVEIREKIDDFLTTHPGYANQSITNQPSPSESNSNQYRNIAVNGPPATSNVSPIPSFNNSRNGSSKDRSITPAAPPAATSTNTSTKGMIGLEQHHFAGDSFSNDIKEKDKLIMDLKETVEMMQIKISKLEQLIKLKDRRIEELTH